MCSAHLATKGATSKAATLLPTVSSWALPIYQSFLVEDKKCMTTGPWGPESSHIWRLSVHIKGFNNEFRALSSNFSEKNLQSHFTQHKYNLLNLPCLTTFPILFDTLADLGGGTRGSPGPRFLHFQAVFRKIGQIIIGWRPTEIGYSCGKSWIRHCDIYSSYVHNYALYLIRS